MLLSNHSVELESTNMAVIIRIEPGSIADIQEG